MRTAHPAMLEEPWRRLRAGRGRPVSATVPGAVFGYTPARRRVSWESQGIVGGPDGTGLPFRDPSSSADMRIGIMARDIGNQVDAPGIIITNLIDHATRGTAREQKIQLGGSGDQYFDDHAGVVRGGRPGLTADRSASDPPAPTLRTDLKQQLRSRARRRAGHALPETSLQASGCFAVRAADAPGSQVRSRSARVSHQGT